MENRKQVIGEQANQGSEAWKEWRKDFKTASEAGIVMGVSPFSTPEKMKQRELGLIPPVFYSNAMRAGNDRENEVREKAEEYFGEMFVAQCWEFGEYGASLDGINMDGDIVVELKVSKHTYNDLQAGIIPSSYEIQVMQQLMCSGAKVGYIVAMEPSTGKIAVSEKITIWENFETHLSDAWSEYEKLEVSAPEVIDLTEDNERAKIELNYVNKKSIADELGSELKEIGAQLKDGVTTKTLGAFTSVNISKRRGATDYKAMFDMLVDAIRICGYDNIMLPNPADFKKPDTQSVSITINKVKEI